MTRVPNEKGDVESPADAGGDAACWAGLLCEECGVVLSDARHRSGCSVSGDS
ncbi:MAG TPA: hypothetical protein VK704_07615 [Acidimicrobiales bacterium]|nr:hypothetical protein [Acidimicrobiales bacterium]